MDNKIVNIPIKYISKNPDNETIFNMNGIEVLANNIKEVGFIGAIDVIENRETNSYEILSGHRRFAAATLAGLEEIPVHIETVSDDIDKAKKLIRLNINNRELNPLDKARAIEYYISNVLIPEGFKGNTQNKIAEVFDISVTQVKYLRRILKYPTELQELIGNGIIPYTGVTEFLSLDEEEQRIALLSLIRAVENNQSGLSKSEAQAIIKKSKEQARLQEDIQSSLSEEIEKVNETPSKVDSSPEDEGLKKFRNETAKGFDILSSAFDNIPSNISFDERIKILEQFDVILNKFKNKES